MVDGETRIHVGSDGIKTIRTTASHLRPLYKLLWKDKKYGQMFLRNQYSTNLERL